MNRKFRSGQLQLYEGGARLERSDMTAQHKYKPLLGR